MLPGARIGSYEVTGALGAGGMGEVYRARDTKLQRDVAIKVLPPGFTHDTERLARFEREARTLASLNHTNIAHVYGLEDSDGSKALVMELVEGPTLAERISVGAVPLAEALKIARQIADALEAAHEQGIVHRDLKPANIKLTPDGVVKVLDFGLAKTTDPAANSRLGMSELPTITTPAMTQAGVILGTAAYMSPEQAKGRPADKRSDVWAFGCVLYEMLAGKRSFAGEDVADTLAFVLTKEPDWRALPADTPEYLRTLLRRCLEKDRRARVPDIALVRFQIDDAVSGAASVVFPERASGERGVSRRERLAWGAALLVCAVTAAWFLWQVRSVSATHPPTVVRFSIDPPGGRPFPGNSGVPRMAVSPDGQYLAFTALQDDGQSQQLWIRRLDSLESRPITSLAGSGGEPVQQPFWSPDNAFIGFFMEGKLRRIELESGVVQTVCDVPGSNYGGTWSTDGTILFGSSESGGIWRVAATGGVPTQVTTLDTAAGEGAHLWPRFLPDGRHFLYQTSTDLADQRATFVGSLDGTARVKVLDSPYMVEFAEPGFLLFSQSGALVAQRFDLRTFRTTGDVVVLSAAVQGTTNGRLGVSVSATGVLVYMRGLGERAADSQLAWLDRTGSELGTLGETATIRGVELSPDGRHVAFHTDDGRERGDIWVLDVDRGTRTRLTFDPEQHNQAPVWTPDGRRIVFAKHGSVKTGIYDKAANGVGSERLVFEGKPRTLIYPTSIAPDGTAIVTMTTTERRTDILRLPATGGQPAGVVESRALDNVGQVSPDGRWLAFQSSESGVPQVFLQSLGSPGTRLQVSIEGGTRPRWRADGRELFYADWSGSGAFHSVSVEPDGEGMRLGKPVRLFSMLTNSGGHDAAYHSTYAVSPDGERFLVARTALANGSTGRQVPLTVVLNWQAALR
jgi:Tol biopolymer transport system component